MSSSYFSAISALGVGDLLAFRDAAETYAACRRQDGDFRWQASPEAARLLAWLGLEGKAGEPSGIAYLDPSRSLPGAVQVRTLVSGEALAAHGLDRLRRDGIVAETVFAALIRSSYGPDGLDYFPTRSELGFYFDDALLLEGSARWDDEYLQACQAFFMEELMPAELVEKSLASLPWEVGDRLVASAQRFAEELHGVTFLVVSELQSLRPLADLLHALLERSTAVNGLSSLLTAVGDDWTSDGWSRAWAALSEDVRGELTAALCPGFGDQAEAILFTAGPALLGWRNRTLEEAIS